MDSLYISLFVFYLVGLAAFVLYLALYGSHRALDERFTDLAMHLRASQGAFDDDAPDDTPLARAVFRWAAARVPTPDPESPAGEKVRNLLLQAGYGGSSASLRAYQTVRFLSLAGFAVAAVLLAITLGKPRGMVMMFGLSGGTLGFVAPGVYLAGVARRRRGEITRQLSDVLDLLVVCVEAGLGLFDAIRIVGVECERQNQAIGRELSLVSSEISAGASLGQALRNLAKRSEVEDLKPLAATLLQSEQLGSQIGPALRSSSDAMRTRRALRAEEAAHKATIKILFPLVVFILPSMLMVIMGPAVLQIINTLGK